MFSYPNWRCYTDHHVTTLCLVTSRHITIKSIFLGELLNKWCVWIYLLLHIYDQLFPFSGFLSLTLTHLFFALCTCVSVFLPSPSQYVWYHPYHLLHLKCSWLSSGNLNDQNIFSTHLPFNWYPCDICVSPGKTVNSIITHAFYQMLSYFILVANQVCWVFSIA